MAERTVFDDVVLRGLEQQYKWAITKVFCTTLPRRSKCWTGFVVSVNPLVILTVVHPVRRLSVRDIQAESTFYIQFYANCNYYPAFAVRWSFLTDLLVLTCCPPDRVSSFHLVDPSLPFLTCTSLFSISHPGSREFRTNRGAVCSPLFLPRDSSIALFDHDVQLYPGASGAPLIDLMGWVHGMQLTDISVKEHAFCVHDASRQGINEYQNINLLPRQVKELPFLTCDLKQAVPVSEIAKCIKLVLRVGVDPNTELTEYLKRSVYIWIMGPNQNSLAQPPAPPPPLPSQGPSAHNKKRKRTKRVRVPRVLSVTDRAAAPSQPLQPPCSIAYSEKLAQWLWAHKWSVQWGLTRPVLVPTTNRVDILVATAKEALEENKSLPPGIPSEFWQPEKFEGGDHDLASITLDILLVEFFQPHQRYASITDNSSVVINDLATITLDPLYVKFLQPRQREGIRFMLECVSGLYSSSSIHGCILADDMGSGKTLQSITLPFTLFCQEFGKKPIVINTDGFAIPRSDLLALAALSCKRWILLSGTPIQNDLDKFFAMVTFSNVGMLGHASYFHQYYQIPIISARQPSATGYEKKLGIERYAELCAEDDQEKVLHEELKQTKILACLTEFKKLCNHPKILCAAVLRLVSLLREAVHSFVWFSKFGCLCKSDGKQSSEKDLKDH